MRFNLNNQQQKARDYLEKLIEKGAKVELTEKKESRTIDQNALYWLWLSAISQDIGYEKEEEKLKQYLR